MISKDINLAISILEAEGIIGFPTETVYGLAGNIYSEKAIQRIYEVKQRPSFNPLIVHLKSITELPQVAADIPPLALRLAETFWPGPLTLLLKKQAHVPDWVTSGKPTVAVRVPRHELALALLNKLDFPLAAPSANPFGSISPTSALHVAQYFKDELELVLDGGPCQQGIESTIVGFENDQAVLYRLGSIALEELEEITGPLPLVNKSDHAPQAPGMLLKHYAPKTPLILTQRVKELMVENNTLKLGVLTFATTILDAEPAMLKTLSAKADYTEAAENLYAALHELDKAGLDLIIAERLPEEGLGRSINDRLERATK